MANKFFYTNGESVKNIDLPQYPDSAWTFSSEAPETDNDQLYAKVAAVYRAANLTADATANIPFALIKKGGESDYDTSDDWQNKVGFLPNPKELIRLWRLSLFMTNSAYGFNETVKGVTKLRYILPTTITPIVDAKNGLTGFTRTLGTTKHDYPLASNRIVYLWRLDHTTELLPSKNTEFNAMMNAAGVLFYSDYFVQSFFKRGGIKPTMLMVKGVPQKADIEKLENNWDKIMRGMYKYLGKVFNAESVEPHVIGDGIESMKDTALSRNKIADIAMAVGMPLSLLLANSANYATASAEYQAWYRDSITPWCEFIAECMNDQLFDRLGLKFVFRPEQTDPGQEDEVQRAQAFSSYVNAGMKLSVAAQIVGIELPEGMEYDDLDDEEPEPEPEQTTETDNNDIPEQQEELVQEPVTEQPKTQKSYTPSIEQLRELELWQSFAYRKFKRGDSLDFPFECRVVPADIANAVRAKLLVADSEDAIKAAFVVTEVVPVADDNAIKALADAINRFVAGDVEGDQMRVSLPDIVVNMPNITLPPITVQTPGK